MTGRQRLLLGFVIGGLITLLAIKPSRALLLHVLHKPAVEHALATSVLAASSGPLPEPGFAGTLDLSGVSQHLLLISKRIVRDPNAIISQRDYDIVLEYLSRGEVLEPDNAYWPQLRAAIAHQAKRPGVWENLEGAAERRYWRSGSAEEMSQLWNKLSRAEGISMSWQGLLARSLGIDDPANLVLTLSELAPNRSDESEAAWRKRYLLCWNFALLREGPQSAEVTASIAAITLQIVDEFAGEPRSRTPALLEQARSNFSARVREIVGQREGDRVAIAIRNAIARQASIVPLQEIHATREQVGFRSLAVGALPSVLFVSGALLIGLAMIGHIVARLFGDIAHPNSRHMIFLGLVGGVVSGIATGAWVFALWIALIIALLGVPVQIAGCAQLQWNAVNQLALGSLCALVIIAVSSWVFSTGPTASFAKLTIPFAAPMLESPTTLGLLTITAITFIAPVSVLWALVKRRPVFQVLGEASARIGITGAAICFTVCVVMTPITIYYDSKLSAIVRPWIGNETEAFRIGQ